MNRRLKTLKLIIARAVLIVSLLIIGTALFYCAHRAEGWAGVRWLLMILGWCCVVWWSLSVVSNPKNK